MNKPVLMSLDQAIEAMLAYAAVNPSIETIATLDADQRVLAQDIHSEIQVPAFDNSAMDGYAFTHADLLPQQSIFQPGQRIPAGQMPKPHQPGQADRVFTGAAIPPGADTVVMQEECEVLPDGRIRIQSQPKRGQCVRQKGEDIRLQDTILTQGQVLNPASLGLLASVGLARVPVFTQPKVALFSTGDELIMPGDVAPADLPPGAIFNSNRFFLKSLLQRSGCVVTDRGILTDNLEATREAFAQAAQTHDVILTSGGVSVGEEDHVKPAIQSLGELHLWSLAIKPGKPFAYGQIQAGGRLTHFMGLPGNPVSSFITFLLLAHPFLRRLQGVCQPSAVAYTLRADFAWPKADKRREFLRVKRNAKGGLDLFANQGSGVLTSVAWADGVVDNPPEKTIAPGDLVSFIPFTHGLS